MVGGGVHGGHRHVQTADKTPLGNVWVSVANKFDIPTDRFGDSTGSVEIF
jgi:hypothetical protein